MDKKSFIYWILGFVIILGIFYLILPKDGPREYDSFASCLTESGFVMYGTEWCPHCKEQKKMFGASFDKINYVDCDIKSQECLVQGVDGYPTWKFNGEKFGGVQTLEFLANKSGCELKKDS